MILVLFDLLPENYISYDKMTQDNLSKKKVDSGFGYIHIAVSRAGQTTTRIDSEATNSEN